MKFVTVLSAITIFCVLSVGTCNTVDAVAKKVDKTDSKNGDLEGFPAKELKSILKKKHFRKIKKQYKNRHTMTVRQVFSNMTLPATTRDAWACGGPPVLTGGSFALPFAWLAISPPGEPMCRAIARGQNCFRYCYANSSFKFCYLNCPGFGFGGTLGYPFVLSSTNYVLTYAFGPFYADFACNIQDNSPGSPLCYV